ncbi:MAG TPA: SDR family oxidoreductase, partial [Ginsengibacter sp.]|nr:SDR family oxidoreductase [Ginsengibacter sp.]
MNIVITGGSKGMGKAIAMRFAAANHHILLNARTESTLKETALEILHAHPDSTVQFCAADLSTREGVATLVHHIQSQSLKVDVLVNNAGIFLPGSVHNEPEGTLDTMIQTNLYSAYHLTRALLLQMMKRRQGHIFNMC